MFIRDFPLKLPFGAKRNVNFRARIETYRTDWAWFFRSL
jgi:hypothetical protein